MTYRPPEVFRQAGNRLKSAIYDEVRDLTEVDEALLFEKNNYKVLISSSLRTSHLRHSNFCFDNGAGSRPIRG